MIWFFLLFSLCLGRQVSPTRFHMRLTKSLKGYILLPKMSQMEGKYKGKMPCRRVSVISSALLSYEWIWDGLPHSTGLLIRVRAGTRVRQVRQLECKIEALPHSQVPLYPKYLSGITCLPALGEPCGSPALSSIPGKVSVYSFSFSLFRVRLEFFKWNLS